MAESKKTVSKGFIILILALIVGILFFLKSENRDKLKQIIQDITVREKSLDFLSRIDLEEGVNSTNLYDNILVKWNNNNLTFLNPDGSISWEKEYTFLEPYIYYGQDSIYAIDKSTGHIYSMDKNGDTVFKVQLNESIFGVNESNNALMVHIKNQDGENIKILNKTGDIILTHEELNHNILYYNLNSAGDNYAISTLNTDGDTIVSNLGIYNFSGEKVKQIDFKNMIILRMEFIEEDMIVLTDTSINYVKDGIVKWKRHFPEIKDMYLDGDKILVLYDKNFETIGLDGKTRDKFVFSSEYNKIRFGDKIVFLYGNRDILGIKGDKELLNYRLDSDILGLYNSKDTVYIHTLKDVEIFKLKTK